MEDFLAIVQCPFCKAEEKVLIRPYNFWENRKYVCYNCGYSYDKMYACKEKLNN